ncbi:MAG: signal recognition particle-docking protein FtsY [Candidatus Bipolaricaulota bacterium]|nr:signal recognition particle-docking protein FtsY [Candidatus Bipolaricaulota bacterium]MDW8141058.1 signal recognition particle-docking protein FtsY [Candidatus Bipolaricaulota bacterium]
MSWFQRLKDGLKKTKEQLVGQLAQVLQPGRRLDDALLAELEEILITADVGVDATTEIVQALKARAAARGVQDSSHVIELLKEILKERLRPAEGALHLRTDGQPTVFLILGVNGSGKTTTIAKLAQHLRDDFGKRKIILAAGDTFRAAAIEQLGIWAERVGAQLVKHHANADPSAVAFDAVERALREHADALFIDTAGRLHTKHNLMEELKKINRVVEKRLGRAIDERLLILDGTTGQNAIAQAKLFHEAVSVTGIVVTKLDGTAKGGAIVQIASALKLPIKLIGVGERADDLREFKADEFVEALL